MNYLESIANCKNDPLLLFPWKRESTSFIFTNPSKGHPSPDFVSQSIQFSMPYTTFLIVFLFEERFLYWLSVRNIPTYECYTFLRSRLLICFYVHIPIFSNHSSPRYIMCRVFCLQECRRSKFSALQIKNNGFPFSREWHYCICLVFFAIYWKWDQFLQYYNSMLYYGFRQSMIPLSGIKAYISDVGGSVPLSRAEYYSEKSGF